MRYGMPEDRCPICGGEAPGGHVQWFRKARCLIGNDRAIILAPTLSRLFDAFWRSRIDEAGLSRSQLAERVGNPRLGGADDDRSVCVYVSNLRQRIIPFGLTIMATGGPHSTWRLVNRLHRRQGYAHV